MKQMYRQILLDERDSPLHRTVYRSSPDSTLDTYELKTVTYGTASAPFLATRVLQQLAEDEQHHFPEAATVLRKDVYVDDLISGSSNITDAINLRKQLQTLLARGGFELRKWASNESAVLEDVSAENKALQQPVDLDHDQLIKTLGLHWDPTADVLRYKVKMPQLDATSTLTKRLALSYIAQLFDPLGLVGPVVTTAKLFMQSLWTLKNSNGNIWGWDEELPAVARDRWQSYHEQLPLLNQLKIKRFVMCPNASKLQLHFFSDASENAYGACAYLRSENVSGQVKVALLTSKSKVTPLKQQSIPRLELCGALLSTELYAKITSSLSLQAETYFWVDSTTILSWLKSPPSTWTTFVANRVSKIQLSTSSSIWRHVAGEQNPADCLSRGTSTEFLLTSKLWWQGPQWLQGDLTDWPISPQGSSTMHSPGEVRKTPATIFSATVEDSFIDSYVNRFSNYQRMIRVTSYCKRFLQNCRLQNLLRPASHVITMEEKAGAENTLIRLVQQQTYPNEWKSLQQQQAVSGKCRLKCKPTTVNTKSSFHLRIRWLVRSFHENNLHAAPQLLLTLLRLRYWITGARNLARNIFHQCTICFRARPKRLQQFMSELPAARITAARPFSTTGIDYWGPITIQPAHRRASPRKAYVVVFVCFCTKAVHLELVADLTTAKFLQALRRFVSRRGLCSVIYSDNGRNFVGAANELRQLVRSKEHQDQIAQECANNNIRGQFNPPKASHFGGLWEAAIQSAQRHFIRALGTQTLAYDDMETLLSQIECCLNSRPLVPISDDPSDLEPLTPGHFLVGSALKAVPDVDVSAVPFNRLRKWQQTQKLYEQIWDRWHREYLVTLQPRTKWCNPPVQLNKDQLFILMDENLPPMHWPTARIDELHAGPDGVVRVVTVRTATGKYTRPVTKICLLPIASTAAPEESSKLNSNSNTKTATSHSVSNE
ncbi:uncharacterized protein LOC135698542 [Ochlerotatus camptorhynchus]|uniref:uncharacterized protein LOC135698542 n=1 Tax=Ochlerotatus camptorhynchus TaxID=644619 RepID=UPI0031E250E2